MRVFGLWEETRVPRGNPRRESENMHTPHRGAEPGTFWLGGNIANRCTTVQLHENAQSGPHA